MKACYAFLIVGIALAVSLIICASCAPLHANTEEHSVTNRPMGPPSVGQEGVSFQRPPFPVPPIEQPMRVVERVVTTNVDGSITTVTVRKPVPPPTNSVRRAEDYSYMVMCPVCKVSKTRKPLRALGQMTVSKDRGTEITTDLLFLCCSNEFRSISTEEVPVPVALKIPDPLPSFRTNLYEPTR